jgi:hypothetical protein
VWFVPDVPLASVIAFVASRATAARQQRDWSVQSTNTLRPRDRTGPAAALAGTAAVGSAGLAREVIVAGAFTRTLAGSRRIFVGNV